MYHTPLTHSKTPKNAHNNCNSQSGGLHKFYYYSVMQTDREKLIAKILNKAHLRTCDTDTAEIVATSK